MRKPILIITLCCLSVFSSLLGVSAWADNKDGELVVWPEPGPTMCQCTFLDGGQMICYDTFHDHWVRCHQDPDGLHCEETSYGPTPWSC